MRPGTALLLATPAAGVDRARFTVVVAACATAGALLLAAARITVLPPGDGGPDKGLAPYVTEDGLRLGVVAGALLLTVPVLALAGQALRVGSGARERRMTALRLAGATPADSRAVAATEAGAAALVAALLAGPAYLLLWVAVGLLPVAGLRMMPPPALGDLAVWAVLVPLATVTGAVAGYRLQQVSERPVAVDRGPQTARPGSLRWMAVTGALLTVGGLIGVYVWPARARWLGGVVVVGMLLMAYAGGPWLVRRAGRRLQRRGAAEHLLAGRRLEVDPRPAGRVGVVLMVCGVVLGVDLLVAAPAMVRWLAGSPPTKDQVVFVNGFGAAATAAAFAAFVAMATLVIGAADQLLEARRPLASLSALGVEEVTLLRVLRRQLSAAAVPAVTLGAVVGSVGLAIITLGLSGGFIGLAPWVLPVLLAAAAVIASVLGLMVAWLTRVAVRALRRPLQAAFNPESLRAP
jgi:hypothetical protein